jgi:ABC-type branched-subunit amino acid transport system ATPase component
LTTNTLKAEGLAKRYGGVQALNSVDFECKSGEVVALMGDNGAGKSTLIRILCGATKPDSGQIIINQSVRTITRPQDAINNGISVVYQDLALVGSMDVARNVFLGHELRKFGFVRIAKMRDEAKVLLDQLKIRISSTKLQVESLSGGQRQCIAIARAVRLGSDFVLLDEPTAALGPEQQANVLRIVTELKESGKGIVIISHNIDHVLAVSDRIVVMRAGQVAGIRNTKETTRQEIVSMIVGDQSFVKHNLQNQSTDLKGE